MILHLFQVMASGMPSLPGLIPSSESTHNQEMNIVERADNLWCQAKEYVPYTNVSCLMKTFSDRWVHMDEPISKLFQNESHLKQRFPYFPNVNEIKQKAALYFVSSDPIIEFAGRPAWSNVIYVGGMHMENARPLFHVSFRFHKSLWKRFETDRNVCDTNCKLVLHSFSSQTRQIRDDFQSVDKLSLVGD